MSAAILGGKSTLARSAILTAASPLRERSALRVTIAAKDGGAPG